MKLKYNLKTNNLYYPNTAIAINNFTIKDAQIIEDIEQELLIKSYNIFFDELDENTVFDEKYFRQLHKRTFGELYEWAGVYRDFNMSKGESRFCQGLYVASSSKKIFEELKNDNYLKGFENKSKEEFAVKLAYYKCEINALHPFCELNGRITRMFFDMIVAYNGYKFIDYSTVTSEEYINGAIECVVYADSSKFEKIIYDGLSK